MQAATFFWRTFKAWRTIRPATMALVVAMAGLCCRLVTLSRTGFLARSKRCGSGSWRQRWQSSWRLGRPCPTRALAASSRCSTAPRGGPWVWGLSRGRAHSTYAWGGSGAIRVLARRFLCCWWWMLALWILSWLERTFDNSRNKINTLSL